MAKEWGGRRVARITEQVLFHKGRTCHLCGLDGADSADHDPPRSRLLAMGVADPDDLRYLWPAHWRPCNNARRARPITDQLRRDLRVARLAHLGIGERLDVSARWARRRPSF